MSTSIEANSRRNRPKSEDSTVEINLSSTDRVIESSVSALTLKTESPKALATNTITIHLPNNRPIMPAHMVVHGTFGNRPIAVSENKYLAILTDGRPVGISGIGIPDHGLLPNNRPIAPNEAVGVAAEMGYLD